MCLCVCVSHLILTGITDSCCGAGVFYGLLGPNQGHHFCETSTLSTESSPHHELTVDLERLRKKDFQDVKGEAIGLPAAWTSVVLSLPWLCLVDSVLYQLSHLTSHN